MTRQEYEYVQERLSRLILKCDYYGNKKKVYVEGVLAAKSVLSQLVAFHKQEVEGMIKYRVEMRTPSGMWISAYYPDYVVPRPADSRNEAEEIVKTVKTHWWDVWFDGPTDYRIVKEEVSHEQTDLS